HVHPLLRIPSFFFNAPPTSASYTLSLHDALPISRVGLAQDQIRRLVADHQCRRIQVGGDHARHDGGVGDAQALQAVDAELVVDRDRKSTRLNSSHLVISYAVFCLKKKK